MAPKPITLSGTSHTVNANLPPGLRTRYASRTTQPRYSQRGLGQNWAEVSTWRRRPGVEVISSGGRGGDWTAEAWAACSQATQQGLWVRPEKGFGSCKRLGARW